MGNQALNPCISAIQDETDAKNRSKPTLINRLLHLATSNSSADNKKDIGQLIIKEVQESVLDYIKDQTGPNGQNLAGFAAGNMLMKLSHSLRPADGGAGSKQLFNVSKSSKLIHESGLSVRRKHSFLTINRSIVYKETQKACRHV